MLLVTRFCFVPMTNRIMTFVCLPLKVVCHLVACVVLSFSPAVFAANGPPPVTIQGVVEEINDVVQRPYVASSQATAVSGTGVSAGFDIPVGKRLIVESLTVLAQLTSGQQPSVTMLTAATTAGQPVVTADIPLTAQGQLGDQDVFKAALPLKLRVSGTSSPNDLTFILSRSSLSGSLVMRVTVFGYLVDIPN